MAEMPGKRGISRYRVRLKRERMAHALLSNRSRKAVKLSIISPPALTGRLMDRIFLETTTLGCRVMEARKAALPRTVEEMDTPWGPVRFKIVNSKVQDTVITRCAPEYEDCLSIARREQIPLQEAYRKVEEFYHTAVKDKGE